MSVHKTIKLVVLLCFFKEISSQREGDLRLASGTSSGGRLEIYINEVWSSICYGSFDIYEGDIACRQLNFLYASAVGTAKTKYGRGYGKRVLSGLDCSTTDTKLIDCSTSSSSCSSLEVALECTNKISPIRLVSDSGRISNLSSGRLEIYISYNWGTVCSHFFSKREADVACRQMGYESANAFTTTSDIGYKDINRRIWLDHLDCSTLSSNANNLRLCSRIGAGITNCRHGNDIFLSCTSPGHIRLRSSSDSNSSIATRGELEMYWNGEWAAVCNYPYFSRNNAQVACRQLGFEKVINYGGSFGSLGKNTSKFLLSGINCISSNVKTLLTCSHDSIGFPYYECGRTATAVTLSCAAQSSTRSTNSRSSSTGSTAGGSVGGAFFFFIIILVVFVYFRYYNRRSVVAVIVTN